MAPPGLKRPCLQELSHLGNTGQMHCLVPSQPNIVPCFLEYCKFPLERKHRRQNAIMPNLQVKILLTKGHSWSAQFWPQNCSCLWPTECAAHQRFCSPPEYTVVLEQLQPSQGLLSDLKIEELVVKAEGL